MCCKLGIYHKAALARAAQASGISAADMLEAMRKEDRRGARLRRRLYAEMVAMCGEKERRRSV